MPLSILNRAHFNPAASGSALTSRPNDGSGFWPDYSNTGHLREPSYPGSVTDYTTGMTQSGWVPVSVANNTTISYKRFLGKTGIGYPGPTDGDNLTFVGCVFEGTEPNDNLLQIYCPNKVTFSYCTFKPNQLSAPPGNSGSISSSLSAPGTPYSQSWQYIATMVTGCVATFDHCNVWGNAGIEATGGTDSTHRGTFTNCYIHDQADNDGSGGSGYHHDGIGPDSAGGSGWTYIDRCTIASLGNTNGIALQGSSTYHDISITNCYISGWGYAVSIGATTPWQGQNITFTDNIFSTELDTVFGPLYGNLWNNTPGTNTWRRNKYQVRSGDQDTGWTTADHGQFWWPTDNVSHASDYTG